MGLATSVAIELSGPLFAAGVSKLLRNAAMDGIEDVAVEMGADVQTQLYPYHGWKTGHLRGSIQTRRFDSLGVVVIGSSVQKGANLPYVYWVETGKRRGRQTRFAGYHMFKNTYDKFRGNFRSWNKLIEGKLVGALE